MNIENPRVIIIGGGPAGLTAAYELSKRSIASVVLEELDDVGGLARTVNHSGCRFDIGGHRFYTKVPVVEQLWNEVLGPEMLERPRLSRIYSRGKFFRYPLEPFEVFRKLGPLECLRCVASYAWAQARPSRPAVTLEDWFTRRFGARLYRRFFATYTEKVWGRPCRELSAEWAAQRVQGLSLRGVLGDAFRRKARPSAFRSLTRTFHYPRHGPGMLWNRVREKVEAAGSRVVLNARVDRIDWRPGALEAVHAGGVEYRGSHFVSSMPVRDLIRCLQPAPSALDGVADCFHYRDFLLVSLILKCPSPFPDNWIYVHDPGVRVGRIQNYGNWSPEMVPDPSITCLGMEYFCNENDELWSSSDEAIGAQARRELGRIGLCDPALVAHAVVLRVPKAYPVYDGDHERGLARIREFLREVPNLQLVGRNGMHRYNNQDHSMLTAMLAVRNILGARFDLWKVHADEAYNEEGFTLTEEDIRALDASQPLVPQPAKGAAAHA
jgi:protoporphyrinogen oxidase